MNQLARAKIDQLKYRSDILETVLAHFGETNDAGATEALAAAVDFAYTDDILFEEFEIWMEERNDIALLFQVRHFLERKGQVPLSPEVRNLTGKRAEIEKFQALAELEAGLSFAKRLQELAIARGLDTNEKLGVFLGVSGERARVLLEGKHKPQLKTLLAVSKKFEVPMESLIP
jgi:hypothetical protein